MPVTKALNRDILAAEKEEEEEEGGGRGSALHGVRKHMSTETEITNK